MYLSARNNSSWVGLHGAELRDVIGQLLPGNEPDVLVLHVCHTPVSCKTWGELTSYGLFSRLQVAPPLPRICYDVFSDYKAIRLQPQHEEYQRGGRGRWRGRERGSFNLSSPQFCGVK